MRQLSRITVSVAAVFFAAVGVAFWIAPEAAGRVQGLRPDGGTGVATLRADLGGLFLVLGALCAIGAWTRRRSALVAAAAILGAILVGRGLGWVAGAGAPGSVPALVVEVLALTALLVRYRVTRAPRVPGGTPTHRLRTAGIASATVLLLAAVGAAMNPALQQTFYDRMAMRMTARMNSAPLADDALRVAIAGSSAPLPSKARAKACVVVFAGGRFWVVDAGPESVENLVLWRIPMSKVAGVLLTHYHSDHIGDLGELQLQTWAGGRSKPLDVYGGPGVDRVVEGFNAAYRLDQGYRTAHHGEQVMPSAAWGMVPHTVVLDGPATPAKDRTGLVYDDGVLRITALEVNHAPIEPAYAYRFDYKGRSVVVSGDLKYHPPLIQGARNADVLVCEAISRTMTHSLEDAARSVGSDRTGAVMHDVQNYHISPEEAAQIANAAHVRLLVFYHLLPAPDGWLPRQLFARGVNKVRDGDWTLADDGALYTLPLGGQDVRIGRMGS